LAPLRGAILLRAARAKYLYQYRKVANFSLLNALADAAQHNALADAADTAQHNAHRSGHPTRATIAFTVRLRRRN